MVALLALGGCDTADTSRPSGTAAASSAAPTGGSSPSNAATNDGAASQPATTGSTASQSATATADASSPPAEGGELAPVSEADPVANGSFVSPLVERFGDVRIGRGSFVAGNSTLRADPEAAVCLGSESNVQDNVLILALLGESHTHGPGECAELAAESGDRTSLAHQAVVTNSTIGDFAFIGFRVEIRDAVVEDGAFILHGAFIEGVTIPADSLVAIGQRVTTQEQADALPKLTEDNNEFKQEVLEVNAEFAEGYIELFEDGGHEAVTGVSAGPQTEWNPNPAEPTLGENVRLEPFARIVGDVRLGADSTVGRRTSIRADEGAPIVIGPRAEIEDRVTFHALRGTSLTVGSDLNTDDNVVFHGPLTVGDRLTIGDDAILFRSEVGNNVTIGERAIVVGVKLPDGTTIPEGAIITTQGQVDALID